MIIQWTNKFSGEKGFVKCINHKERYFENTFDSGAAMRVSIKSGSAGRALAALEEYCPSNDYAALNLRKSN